MTAATPLGGADPHGDTSGTDGRESGPSVLAFRSECRTPIVGLELAGTGDLVVRPLGTPLDDRADERVDARTRRLALQALWLASIALTVFVLFLAVADSAAAAALVSLPVTAVWILCLRGGDRFVPRAVGRLTTLVVGAAMGAFVLSAVARWVPAVQLDVTFDLVMTSAVLVLTVSFEMLAERVAEPTRVLVVGAGPSAAQLVGDVESDPDSRFEIVGVAAEAGASPRSTCAIEDVGEALARERPDLVVVAVEAGRLQVFRQLLDSADAGFRVVGLPEFYEHAFGRVPVRRLSAAWFMSVLHLYQPAYSRIGKRLFDVAVATTALVLTAPVLASIALMMFVSRGPVIYRQRRVGENGREFTIFKFRTMDEGAERDGEAVWAQARDSRITGLGRFLRNTRLDELPQLWNVLKGDMSIVGPRPERPEFLLRLEEEVPFWSRRHLLKPGITGWAQVHSGYASDVVQTEEKLSYDLWYLRHRSFVVDLAICAKTIRTLVSGEGAR